MAKKDDRVIPEELEAALLEAIAPVPPAAAVAARVRGRVLDQIRAQPGRHADDLLTVSHRSDDWIETSPGNRVKILRSDDESMSMLVRLEPGTTFPRHSHPADEETYVIEGETWFGDIRLEAGDYHLAPSGTEHGEVRTETGCLLFIRKASE